MKTIKKVIAIMLAAALASAVLASCGNKGKVVDGSDGGNGNSATVTGEDRTWGNITIFVPDGFTLKGGDILSDENPDKLTLNSDDSDMTYVTVTANADDDNVKMGIESTRSMNEGAEDYTVAAGETEWTGVTYNASGYQCYALCAPMGDGYVMLTCAGVGEAALNLILESIKVSAAD